MPNCQHVVWDSNISASISLWILMRYCIDTIWIKNFKQQIISFWSFTKPFYVMCNKVSAMEYMDVNPW